MAFTVISLLQILTRNPRCGLKIGVGGKVFTSFSLIIFLSHETLLRFFYSVHWLINWACLSFVAVYCVYTIWLFSCLRFFSNNIECLGSFLLAVEFHTDQWRTSHLLLRAFSRGVVLFKIITW